MKFEEWKELQEKYKTTIHSVDYEKLDKEVAKEYFDNLTKYFDDIYNESDEEGDNML